MQAGFRQHQTSVRGVDSLSEKGAWQTQCHLKICEVQLVYCFEGSGGDV